MWFAGIDWADDHHDAVVLTDQGQLLGALRVPHTAEGLDHLTRFLRGGASTSGAAEPVICLVETQHGLLITALLEAGFTVCPVNPLAVGRLRPPSGVKTDALDARLLARLGRNDWPALRVLQPDGPLLQELKTLTRDLEGLLREQTRLVNQLTACLKASYPAALRCFDGLTRQVTVAFLQAFPTPEAAAAASLDQLTQVLAQGHYPHPRQKAEQLAALLQAPQLHALPGVARAKARLMAALRAQLAVLTTQVAAFDQAIQQLFAQHADSAVFASLPGAGRRLAPRLLAEWGEDRTRYASAASVRALAGTAPVLFQSGAFRGVRRRRACVNAWRQALYHFAWESVLCEPWAKAYSQRKRAQGKTYAMALRAVANQWVRIIYAMWQARQPYQRAIFLAAQHAHGGMVA
jgi:transposase